jgi:prepilin-type N-terminal cleavage/methylation domain-containing protein
VVKRGFTLNELLVVVAIIGLLSSIVLASLQTAREKAKIAATAATVRDLKNEIALYISDTGIYPPYGCGSSCAEADDPLTSNPVTGHPKVAGWNGPYKPAFYNLVHPWGGQIGYMAPSSAFTAPDWNGDTIPDYGIDLNDDSPGGSNNNLGQIPTSALQKIDAIFDDGNLATGNVRGGNSAGVCPQNTVCSTGSDLKWKINCVVGELCIKLSI